MRYRHRVPTFVTPLDECGYRRNKDGKSPKVLLDFVDWNITLREVVFSILILGVMFFVGFMISTMIEKHVADSTLKYRQAVAIESPDEFKHAMFTDVGHAFVRGRLVANDYVTTDLIPGKWLCLEIKHQKYQKHTRTVHYTVTDSKGRTHHRTRQETYWSWDTVKTTERHSNNVTFCGFMFPYGKFSYDCAPMDKTIVGGGLFNNERDVIYTTSDGFDATIFAKLGHGGFAGKASLISASIEKYRKSMASSWAVPIFWVCWTVFSVFALVMFYVIENDWLED